MSQTGLMVQQDGKETVSAVAAVGGMQPPFLLCSAGAVKFGSAPLAAAGWCRCLAML
jgi:hypothetical protein